MRTIAPRQLLLYLGLVLAASALVWVNGAPVQPATAMASPTPPGTPSAGPTGPSQASPTPAPQTPQPTVDLPPPPDVLTAAGWPITIQRPTAMPWQSVEARFDGARVGIDAVADQVRYVLTSDADHKAWDISFGHCASNGCGRPLITVSLARRGSGLLVGTTDCDQAPPAFVFDCTISNDVWPVMIAGATAAELKEAWVAEFGAATASRTSVDGEPAALLQRGNRWTLLAVHEGVLVAVIYETYYGDDREEAAAAFDAVIESFRFD